MRIAFLCNSFLVLCVALFYSCASFQEEALCVNEVFIEESRYVGYNDVFSLETPESTVWFSKFMADTLEESEFYIPTQLKLTSGQTIEVDFAFLLRNPHTPRRKQIMILINSSGLIMLNNDITSLNDLSEILISELKSLRAHDVSRDSIAKRLNAYERINQAVSNRKILVDIDWDTRADRAKIENTLESIQNSFTRFYEEMSIKYFDKTVCELDSIEIHAVKNCQCVLVCQEPPPPPNINPSIELR